MPDEALEAYRKAVKDCADGALIGDERRHHLEPYVARFERAVRHIPIAAPLRAFYRLLFWPRNP